MSEYVRWYEPGRHYFFTVVTHNRKPILTLPHHILRLKEAFALVKSKYPFTMNAYVILPDHLHVIWKMPDNDHDFSTRWRLIKRHFSIGIATGKNQRNEKNIWQRRFWEHVIRDEIDWERHMDYIHYNPAKHKYVSSVNEWKHSSFHYWVKKGVYDVSWGSREISFLEAMEGE